MTPQGLGPLVSVVMPFKDARPYLAEAAGSVLGQRWPRVQLVLVDDGGTDGSRDLAEKLRAAHPDRVLLLEHAGRVNRGIGASRRLGFERSAGTLLAGLDADDVWEPGHLEHEVGLLLASGADVVHGRSWRWSSWNGAPGSDVLETTAFAPGAVVPGQALIEAVLRDGGSATPPCCVLFRRSLLGPWSEVLDDFPGMYEDQVLHFGLLLRGTVVMSGATSAWYRQHLGSISAAQLGLDPATRFDQGRSEHLSWLAGQPGLEPQVAALVQQNQDQLRQRSRAAASPLRPRSGSASRSGARQAARRVVAAVERVIERRAPEVTASGRDSARARPARVGRLLHRFGADLHGRVLVLTHQVELPPELLGAEVHGLPSLPCLPGPGHPWATLPAGSADAVVVLDEAVRNAGPDDLRHLRRVLSPGGVLLLFVSAPHEPVVRSLNDAFGADAVRHHWQGEPGPRRRPLLALRAAVPVCGPVMPAGSP